MFLVTFFTLSRSWNDMTLTVAMEMMFRNTGDNGKINCQKIIDCNNDELDRLSLVGSWIDFVERAPFNTKCFNHWRYKKNPIGQYTKPHVTEDILQTLKSLNQSIFKSPQVNGEWQINFVFKSFFGLFLEATDPTHTVEYFNPSVSELIDGDNNGKLFKVKYNGNETNLHDFWGSLCGELTDHYPFSADAYKKIDDYATSIFRDYNPDNYHAINDYKKLFNETFSIAESSVYDGVEYGQELSRNYIQKCQTVARKQLAIAAYSLGSLQKNLVIPQCQPLEKLGKVTKPVNGIQAIGWTVFCLLLPVAFYLGRHLFKNRDSLKAN